MRSTTMRSTTTRHAHRRRGPRRRGPRRRSPRPAAHRRARRRDRRAERAHRRGHGAPAAGHRRVRSTSGLVRRLRLLRPLAQLARGHRPQHRPGEGPRGAGAHRPAPHHHGAGPRPGLLLQGPRGDPRGHARKRGGAGGAVPGGDGLARPAHRAGLPPLRAGRAEHRRAPARGPLSVAAHRRRRHAGSRGAAAARGGGAADPSVGSRGAGASRAGRGRLS